MKASSATTAAVSTGYQNAVDWCDTHSLGNQLLFTPSASSYAADAQHQHNRIVRIPDLPHNPSHNEGDGPGGAQGWIPCVYAPSQCSDADASAPLLVIHFHGTGGDAWKSGRIWFDATKALSQAERALERGSSKVRQEQERNPSDVAVLSVEYPGYGVFDGRTSDVVCRRVATAVLRYVLLDLRVPPNQVVLCGRSMGSGVACYASCVLTYRHLLSAAADGNDGHAAYVAAGGAGAAMDDPIPFRAVVLVSPFTCVHGVLEGFPLGSMVLHRLVRNRFPNAHVIAQLAPSTKLVVVHGTKDPLIPWQQGERLVALATQCADRKLVLDEQGDHHNLPRLPEALKNALLSSAIRTNEQQGWQRLSFETLTPQQCRQIVSSHRRQQRRLRIQRVVGVVLTVGVHWRCSDRLRWIALLWSCALLGLGLAHRSMGCALNTSASAAGRRSNRVAGMNPKVRFAIATVLCRCVLPVLAVSAGGCGPLTAAVGTLVTHMLLR